jgi:hypothetical protein
MTKVCTWIPLTEYEAINKSKGDISASLWIRRAIQNALSGEQVTNQPRTANAYTTTPNQPVTNQEVRVS